MLNQMEDFFYLYILVLNKYSLQNHYKFYLFYFKEIFPHIFKKLVCKISVCEKNVVLVNLFFHFLCKC